MHLRRGSGSGRRGHEVVERPDRRAGEEAARAACRARTASTPRSAYGPVGSPPHGSTRAKLTFGRDREVAHRRARVRLLHELDPDRDRDAAAGDLVADRRRVIAADPHARDEIGGEADEPDVAVVRRRAGLAGGGAADRRARTSRCRAGRRPSSASIVTYATSGEITCGPGGASRRSSTIVAARCR